MGPGLPSSCGLMPDSLGRHRDPSHVTALECVIGAKVARGAGASECTSAARIRAFESLLGCVVRGATS